MENEINQNSISKQIVDFFVSKQDERTKTWFLSATPGPLFMIIATYLYFCLYAGPAYMKNRKPFELKNVLIIYNFVQVLFSCYLVYEGLQAGWLKDYSYKCQPVDYSPNGIRMAGAVWLYFIAKVVELLDTVFFVLRKRTRQITFLHLYHHTMMPICSFVGVKYMAGGHGTLLGLINSFIHVIMYAYYMFSAIPSMQKYLWWKKYLTSMQIIQFAIVFVHTIQIQFQPDCTYPKQLGGILSFNALLFFYMFSSFYVQNYAAKPKQPDEYSMKSGKTQ